jgi:hypothetical protein
VVPSSRARPAPELAKAARRLIELGLKVAKFNMTEKDR